MNFLTYGNNIVPYYTLIFPRIEILNLIHYYEKKDNFNSTIILFSHKHKYVDT